AHSSVYFCHCGKRGSTWLKSRNSLLTLGPVQPSSQSLPVAESMSFESCMLSLGSEFSMPLMNISVTVWTVPGPGTVPLHASTFRSTMPFGSWNFAIGVPFVTSVMILFQSGAVLVVDSTGWTGAASELPIHTPTAIAGWLSDFGGATK